MKTGAYGRLFFGPNIRTHIPKTLELHVLVIARQTNERLLIGDGIMIEIREVRGNQIRIGIEAPPEVKVLREELVEPTKAG
jgi:carbon storage regulator CsrA